jgi:hypothetical protein
MVVDQGNAGKLPLVCMDARLIPGPNNTESLV